MNLQEKHLHGFFGIILTYCRVVFTVCVSGLAVLYSTTHGRTLTGMEADMSPMWQAGMAPTAAPSQLRLTLLCHDRLDGLPFTAHEFGGGRGLDPPDTGCIMFGQSSDTTGHGAQYPTFRSCVFGFQGKYIVFRDGCCLVLCSLTLPSLCNGTEMFQDPQGPLSLDHM